MHKASWRLNFSILLIFILFTYGINLTHFFSTSAIADTAIDKTQSLPLISECPLPKKPQKISFYIKNDANSPYFDPNRELKDVGTDLVVKELFNTKDRLFNFIKLLYSTIDTKLEEYRKTKGLNADAISLIFKGGNVMRIVANQVFNLVSTDASEFLKKAYGENFKRSDIDLSILVNPSKLLGYNYENIMSELLTISYDALNKIREEIVSNYTKYLDLAQMNARLPEYYEKIKNLEAMQNPNNPNWYQTNFTQLQLLESQATKVMACPYEGQFDYRYEFNPKDKRQIIGTPLSDDTHWIMNSINKTLEWHVKGHLKKIIKFYLPRSKIQFQYTYIKDNKIYRKPIGGELIDLSLPHRDDFRLKNFLENENIWITNYRLTLEDTQDSFEFKAESLAGLEEDIYSVIFEEIDRPWENLKYQKRINRLFFFAIVDMISSQKMSSDMVNKYISLVENQIISPLEGLFPLNEARSKDLASKLKSNVENITNNFSEMTAANEIWHGINILVQNQLIKNPLAADEENFKKFLELIKIHLANMLKVKAFQKNPINEKDIYNAKMSSFF